jgi:Trypsin-like peptidase domain/TPR repeat
MIDAPLKQSGPSKFRLEVRQRVQALFRFSRHYAKELVIAFVLAIVAALLIDAYRDRTTAEILKTNRTAVAVVSAYNEKGDLLGTGSGVFIHPDGTLITNYHVIEGATAIEARLPSGAFYKLKTILGARKDGDIAILKFDAEDTPAVRGLGDSDTIAAGQKVVAIGSPLGLAGTVSDGIVSNPRLTVGTLRFIQFTAPISPGSSGGGLFDTDGKVVGLTTSSANIPAGEQEGTAQNLNLAVPINLVKDALTGKDITFTEQSPQYYLYLGDQASDRQAWGEALENYRKAANLDDRYAAAYEGLGGAYYELGKYDLEVENYLKATRADPSNPDYYYYLATAYEDTADYDDALAAYQKTLELKPDNKDALHDLGILYLALGEEAKASALVPHLMSPDQGLGKKLKLLVDRRR